LPQVCVDGLACGVAGRVKADAVLGEDAPGGVVVYME
jgi:hypothetical protein